MSDIDEGLLACAEADHMMALELTNMVAELEERIEQLEALRKAVMELPVEEWEEGCLRLGARGEPEYVLQLVGYTMRAREEWDEVKRCLAALQKDEV